jgi:uncharacterized OB-fold protein
LTGAPRGRRRTQGESKKMSEITRPIPEITAELRPFFEASRQGQLVVQKCDSCGALRFPPRRLCANCLSRQSSWTPVSGEGEVYSFIVMHRVYHPAFASQVPYAVATVKLKEGARILSNVIGIDPHQIKCGMPVKVSFEKLNEEVTLPMFRPAASPG